MSVSPDDICPLCNGRKVCFEQISDSTRREIPCVQCSGTGRLSIALAMSLSGESAEELEELRKRNEKNNTMLGNFP